MCGRYYRRSDKQRIAEAFSVGKLPEGFVLPDWDYNVAPTGFQPVIRHNKEIAERELVLMRWGLVPHFAASLNDFRGISTINARAESLMKGAMWHIPFQRRRCLDEMKAKEAHKDVGNVKNNHPELLNSQ